MAIGNYKLVEKGIRIEFFQDDYNPRKKMENLTKMVCFYPPYNLGDDHDYYKSDYNTWEELAQAILSSENVLLLKPLYVYDHSSITISTTSFTYPWDSGQIGWIYITKEQAERMRTPPDKFEEVMENEIKMYNTYLARNIYGLNIYEDGELIDSCGGFVGDNPHTNGMLEYIDKKYHVFFEGVDSISEVI